jgi:hypothetical protein
MQVQERTLGDPPGRVGTSHRYGCRVWWGEEETGEPFRLKGGIPDDSISQQALGWISAAIDLQVQGYDLPEPDKFEWLSPEMQYILGAFTMKKFMKMDFFESKRELELLKVR